MSTDATLQECIDDAAETVAPAWPLHSFVTVNPLSGFEDRPFHEAVAAAEDVLGGRGYPAADVFRRAWETGRVDPERLQTELAAHGYEADPETSLERLAAAEPETTGGTATATATDRVDAVLSKWLSAFLDQGQAEWPMPDREQGFYDAFQAVARHDGEVPDADAVAELPDDPLEAVCGRLADRPVVEWPGVLEGQLAALPGWTGLVRRRVDDDGAWQSAYPITLAGYLAARLALVDAFNAPLIPEAPDTKTETDGVPPAEVWLDAWEASYRSRLVDALETDGPTRNDGRPDAQLVFCIDTRSEIIRRHLEAAGDYETHGYAGFFGIPMRHAGYDSDVTVDACPPVVDAQHRIADRPVDGSDDARAAYDRRASVLEAGRAAVKRLKSNAATAFSFVESAGAGYGAALAARTLLPGRVYDLLEAADERRLGVHEFCEPSVDYDPDSVHELREGLTLEEKIDYVASAFELMGWEEFARVVVFVGHASQTTNNPFDASLDCGACAGNPGGPNARVLAAICNDEAVRAALRERGIDVPEDTVFLAGEHNTTTDEVALYDGDIPESHAADIERLRGDLETARAGAAAERAGDMGAEGAGVRETERRAGDWAETRPEWGLAGNAGFVIGPRALTDDLDLDGRAFLHSYDPATDPDGDALAAIVAGPVVVTQWINAQYYFATVDNAAYGSGSKVTQNPVGNVGVYQGNGGDLQTGLPAQSLVGADGEPYHQPLRLSVVIYAPVERVTEVLANRTAVTGLLDGGWLSLTVVDPQRDGRAFDYEGDLEWSAWSSPSDPTGRATPPTADDD